MDDMCPVCGQGKLIEHKDILTTKPCFYDFEVTIETHYSICDACEIEIAGAEQIDRNAANMKQAVKEALNGEL